MTATRNRDELLRVYSEPTTALEERDEVARWLAVADTAPVPLRFLREPFADPLTAAIAEARTSAGRVEALTAEVGALRERLRRRDARLERKNRFIERQDRQLREARAVARRSLWGAVALGCAYLTPTALVWAEATGLPALAAAVGLLGFVGLCVAVQTWGR